MAVDFIDRKPCAVAPMRQRPAMHGKGIAPEIVATRFRKPVQQPGPFEHVPRLDAVPECVVEPEETLVKEF